MIRKAEEKDIKEIVKLHLFLIKHLKSSNPERYIISKQESINFLDKLNRYIKESYNCILVYEHEGVIAGYAIGRIKKYPVMIKEKEYGEVYEIVVSPKFQGKGIAKAFVNKLIKWFKSNKIKAMELLVDSKNLEANRAWTKLGFKEQLRILERKV